MSDWETLDELITGACRRRAEIERRQAELNAEYDRLVSENSKLQTHKNIVAEEINILCRIIEELSARSPPRTVEDEKAHTAAVLEGSLRQCLDAEVVSFESKQHLPAVENSPTPADAKRLATLREVMERVRSNEPAAEEPAPAPLRIVRLPEKKKINTVLHSILDTTNEKGRVRVKDVSRELGLEDRAVMEWANIMAKRGMLKLDYSASGVPFLEKS